MVWMAPLRAEMQSVRLVSGTVSGMLDVGHGTANVVVRLSLALFCFGLILQALSNAADPYRCGALVRHGSWPPYTPPKVNTAADYEQLETLQRQGREPPPARPFDKWEPAGCRMHEYSRDDIRECLGGKRILFVGDSTMRVLFFAALTRLEHEAAEWLLRTTFTEANPRHNLAIDSETVQLQFIWDPWLNSTAFEDEIRTFEPGGDKDIDPADKPDLVIMGSVGLWAARNAGDDKYFDTFQSTTDRLTRAMAGTIRPFGKQKSNNYVFLAPVTIPRYEMLLPGRAEAFSPERIKRMNNYLGKLSPTAQSHILSSYNDMTNHISEAYEDTGLHVTASVAERWIDVPLNARCNGFLFGRPAADQPVPSMAHTTTCCAAYPGLARGQRALWYIICSVIAAPAAFFLFRGRATLFSSHISCTFVGISALFCYMADRSHAFAKSEKHYTASWLYSGLILTGLLFITSQRRQSRRLRTPASVSPSPHRASLLEVDFLPRHISNEWKGLLQAAFLLLAYQDHSQTTIFTRWSEFFTSSYLFLSAFGHTSYFLRYSDFSLRRVASVLLQLNLLPCLLALMLDGRETGTANSVSHLYSFSRLVSFWFLVVYTTLRIGSHTNRSRPHSLLLRIFMSASILVYVGLRPGPYGFFETANRAARYLFGDATTWAVEGMRLAVYTDWCAPYIGMVVAVLAQRAAIVCDRIRRQQEQKHKLLSGQNGTTNGRPRTSTGPSTNGVRAAGDRARANTASSTHFNAHISPPDDVNVQNAVSQDAGWLDRLLIAVLYPDEFTAPLQTMVVIFSAVFLVGFVSATSVAPLVKGETSHPYMTIVAVVSFAVMRNCHSRLRATYMAIPAALGTMALELFVLHNHILLSGNGTGRLRLLSIYPSAVEEGFSFFDNLNNAKVAVVQCFEIISITTVFLLVSRHTQRSTRFITTILFGESAIGDADMSLSAIKGGTADDAEAQLASFNAEYYELPKYGDGSSSNAKDLPARRPGPSGLSVKIRAASLLFLLWGFNRFYI